MLKIAYNTDFGGFSLSDEAIALGRAVAKKDDWHYFDLPRHDATLVFVIETLGEKANGGCADLALRAVPVGTRYRIQEYDGSECVILELEEKYITVE